MAVTKPHILRMLWAQRKRPNYLCTLNHDLMDNGVITPQQCADMRDAIYAGVHRRGRCAFMYVESPKSGYGLKMRRRFLIRLLFGFKEA